VEEVEAFSRWVGLVVAVFAGVLVAPRATAASWGFLRRGLRRVTAEQPDLPVVVREGVRTEPARQRGHLRHFHGPAPHDDVEVLDTEAPPRRPRRRPAATSVAALTAVVESRAVLLLLSGLLLRFFGDLLAVLPEPAVIVGDLVLVLLTFLVLRHVVYTYVPVAQVVEVVAPRVARAHAPFDQILRLVLLSVAAVLLVTWPSQVGWQLAQRSFGTDLDQARPVVAWACELPWLLGLAWLVVRSRLREQPA
jgi:hypothetical protein